MNLYTSHQFVVFIQVCACARAHVCVRACVRVCMCVCMHACVHVCTCVCILACDLPVIDFVGLIDLVRVSSDTVLTVDASDVLLFCSAASSACIVSPSPYPTMSMGPRGESLMPCPIDPFPASQVTTGRQQPASPKTAREHGHNTACAWVNKHNN